MNFLIPSLFLPNLDFFTQILPAEKLIINSEAKYTKQSYANRCYIKGPHKIERLIVPIQKPGNNTTISEVKIAYTENWQLRNWRTVSNCYRKSPFFEYYEPYFRQILLENSFDNLIDLNNSLLTLCLKLTQIQASICHVFEEQTPEIRLEYKNTTGFSNKYTPFPYLQNFGNDFVPNLSIIDLLFCKGPETRDILNKSNPNEQL